MNYKIIILLHMCNPHESIMTQLYKNVHLNPNLSNLNIEIGRVIVLSIYEKDK